MVSLMEKLRCQTCASRTLGLFCDLPDASLAECNNHKTTNTYQAGQVLFYEGNTAFGVYCVFSGQIKLYKTGHGGRLQIVRIAGKGDLLGYRSLFADEPYAATAEVMQDATVCFIEKGAMFSMLRANPDLAGKVIRKLATELRQAEDRMTDIAQRPVKERLAELLLMLKETYGEPHKHGTEIDLRLTREELAQMIGTTQETVIRLLSEFRAAKILEVNGRQIIIPNIQPLLQIARIED